jgi:hypothetical protein
MLADQFWAASEGQSYLWRYRKLVEQGLVFTDFSKDISGSRVLR